MARDATAQLLPVQRHQQPHGESTGKQYQNSHRYPAFYRLAAFLVVERRGYWKVSYLAVKSPMVRSPARGLASRQTASGLETATPENRAVDLRVSLPACSSEAKEERL
jgi:hypothetical protein